MTAANHYESCGICHRHPCKCADARDKILARRGIARRRVLRKTGKFRSTWILGVSSVPMSRATRTRLRALLRNNRVNGERFQDHGNCPYFQYVNGWGPQAICDRGCYEEPVCLTNQPRHGWPSQHGKVKLPQWRPDQTTPSLT